MNLLKSIARSCALVSASFSLISCVSYPTLQQMAIKRQNGGKPSNDLTIAYKITDLDVINYTDKVKESLSKRFNTGTAVRYGSSATQVTLATLAGAAETAGWSVGTASGLGLATGYIFSLGQIFDAKGKAQAYEQGFTAVQAAEATYYFHRLGMGFNHVGDRTIVVAGDPNGRSDIPSSTHLTPDGETLYYRVSKVLKVLNDALANKIPDLQDLKDAKGESNGVIASPAKSADTAPTVSHVARSAPPPEPKPELAPPVVDDAARRAKLVEEANALPVGKPALILGSPKMSDEAARKQLRSLINSAVDPGLQALEAKVRAN